jgi:hypothetical protein
LIPLPLHAQEDEKPSFIRRAATSLEDYYSMAGSRTWRDFRPLTQPERNKLYLKGLINPFGFFKAATSAAIDHANDKPSEWGQGASGYGKRFANISGQYAVQKTVTFAVSSALHEDNRYFNSGKRGFGARLGYALTSSFLAFHDNGERHVSISLLGGIAAGAFTARLWLPASESSASDGAVSFGISLGGNVAATVFKEFLPDLLRLAGGKRSAPQPVHTPSK